MNPLKKLLKMQEKKSYKKNKLDKLEYSENGAYFRHVFDNNFFWCIFSKLLNRFEISMNFCVFTLILNFLIQFFLLLSALIVNSDCKCP